MCNFEFECCNTIVDHCPELRYGAKYSKSSCFDTPVPGFPSYGVDLGNICNFRRHAIWPYFEKLNFANNIPDSSYEGTYGVQFDPYQVSGYVVLAMGLVIIALMFYMVLWDKLQLSRESWWVRFRMVLIFGLPFFDVTSDVAFLLTTPFVNQAVVVFVALFIILHPIVFICHDLYKKGIRLTVLNRDLITQYNTWISSKGLTYSNLYVSVGWVLTCCVVALWNLPMLLVLFVIYFSKWNCISFMSNWWYSTVTKSDKYHVDDAIIVSEYHKSVLLELLLETTPMLILQLINIHFLQQDYGLSPSPISILSLVISCLTLAQIIFRYGYSFIWERKKMDDIELGHLKSDSFSKNIVTSSDMSVVPIAKVDAYSDVEMSANDTTRYIRQNEVKMLIKEEIQPLLEALKQLQEDHYKLAMAVGK